jgi:hypothetical protein
MNGLAVTTGSGRGGGARWPRGTVRPGGLPDVLVSLGTKVISFLPRFG